MTPYILAGLIVLIPTLLYFTLGRTKASSTTTPATSSGTDKKWPWGDIFTWIILLAGLVWTVPEALAYWNTDRSEMPVFLLIPVSLPLVVWIVTKKHEGGVIRFYLVFGTLLGFSYFVFHKKVRLQEFEAKVDAWASSPTHSSAMMEEVQLRKGNTEVRYWKGEFKPLKASSWKPCEAKLDWGFDSLTFELLSMKNHEFFSVTVQNVPGSLTAEGTWTWHSSDKLRRLDGKVTINVPLPKSADKYAPISGTLHGLPKKGESGDTIDIPFLLTPSNREDYLRRVLR